MSLAEYERSNSGCEPLSFACALGPTGHSVDEEVTEYRSPARGVWDRLLIWLLDLWTALLDERLERLLLDVVGVIIVVLVTFPLSLLPNLNPAPKPSSMP